LGDFGYKIGEMVATRTAFGQSLTVLGVNDVS